MLIEYVYLPGHGKNIHTLISNEVYQLLISLLKIVINVIKKINFFACVLLNITDTESS